MSDAGHSIPDIRPLPTSANPVVEERLAKAAADLETAAREAVVAGARANYDAVCFHAQQAIEKLMRAALIARGISPPHTHDLSLLAGAQTSALGQWPYNSKELRLLTLGAVRYRDPGLAATQQDSADALAIAAGLWRRPVTLVPQA